MKIEILSPMRGSDALHNYQYQTDSGEPLSAVFQARLKDIETYQQALEGGAK